MALELGSCSRVTQDNVCRCNWSLVLRRVSPISLPLHSIANSLDYSPHMPLPPPTSTHTIHAALFRASQPSLGTVVLSALIMASIRIMGLLVLALRALPLYLPPYMRFVSVGAAMAVGYLETVTNALSTYALVYTGLTGDPFLPSARRARTLTGAVESSSLARYRRKFKTERKSHLKT